MKQQLISALNKKPETADEEGFYGKAPSKECKDNAAKFLASLPKYYQEIIKPEEHITTQPHGTIVIDWYFRKQFVSVEIGDTLVGFFSDFDDGINPECNGMEPGAVRDTVVQALNKLYRRNDE